VVRVELVASLRGTTKLSHVDESEEPVHVLIRGPTEDAVAKAKSMVQMLIDFSSAEGEELRQKQWRELAVLNGTLREEETKEQLNYQRLFVDPKRARTGVGPLGMRHTGAVSALNSGPSSVASLTTEMRADNGQAQFDLLMAELNELESPPEALASAVPSVQQTMSQVQPWQALPTSVSTPALVCGGGFPPHMLHQSAAVFQPTAIHTAQPLLTVHPMHTVQPMHAMRPLFSAQTHCLPTLGHTAVGAHLLYTRPQAQQHQPFSWPAI